MNEEVKNAFSQFMDHVKNMDTMIKETNTKLERSKMIIKELKTIYNVAINKDFTSDQPKESQEDYDISKLLNSKCSLLLPDMEEDESLNLNEIQKKLKAYIEEISSNAEIDLQSNLRISIDGPKSSLNLQEYANDLNTMKQCTNNFNTIKLDNNAFKRDLILEGQLIKLIDNVESFTNVSTYYISIIYF